MIDTVCLSLAMHPRLSDRELMNIGAKKPKGRTAFVINPAKGETTPAITFQMHPTRGHPERVQYLTARFSLPRQRWHHNARLPATQADLYEGLGIAADAIYRATGLIFNPLTANVTDVHYAMDFQVGTDRIRPILNRLETRQIPRYKLRREDHGVVFRQKQANLLVYSKFVEVRHQIETGHIQPDYHSDALEAAEGVLRVEYRQTLQALERSQKRQGLSRLASEVLTPDASHRIITEALEKLQFDEAVNNAESNPALVRLIECYGVKTAMRLIGFLSMVESFGRDFWRILNYPKRTYDGNLRLCKEAGVWALDK